jgi:hypothetical protein
MHPVVFDIDGTLTNTNLEDGELQWRFWLCRPQLQRRMFVGYVFGGTLVYRRMCCDAEHSTFHVDGRLGRRGVGDARHGRANFVHSRPRQQFH